MWADCATGGSVGRAKTRALHRENRSRGPSATRRFWAEDCGLPPASCTEPPRRAQSLAALAAGRPSTHSPAGANMPAATGKAAAKGKGCAPPAADAPSIGHKTVKLLSLAALLLSDFAVLMAVLSVVAYVAAGAPFSYIAGVLAVCVVAYAAVCAYCAFSANRRFVRLFSTMVKQGEVDKVALHEVEDALAGKRVDWGGGARSARRAAPPPRRWTSRSTRTRWRRRRRSRRARRARSSRRARCCGPTAAASRPAPRRLAAVRRRGRGGGVPPRRRQLSRRSVRSAHVTPFYRLMAFGWQPYIHHCDRTYELPRHSTTLTLPIPHRPTTGTSTTRTSPESSTRTRSSR